MPSITRTFTLWAVITAVLIAMACGQLLAVFLWWPQICDGIENTYALTPEELRSISAFELFVVYVPFVLHVAGFGLSISHVVKWRDGRRWLVTLLVSLAGIGTTWLAVYEEISHLA